MKKLIKATRDYILNLLWKPLNIHTVHYVNGHIKSIRLRCRNKEFITYQIGKLNKCGFKYIYKTYEFGLFRIGFRY